MAFSIEGQRPRRSEVEIGRLDRARARYLKPGAAPLGRSQIGRLGATVRWPRGR